ncbi:MAG: S8 family peptidase [Clostridiales bacterium]|nr:S8 family peptidase [Clostridiales bacterium]
MTEEERISIISEDYVDGIIDYRNNPAFLAQFSEFNVHILNESFAIIHVPAANLNINTVSRFGYSTIPLMFGLVSEVSLEASRVNLVRTVPTLNLRGQGILVACIDTGIDYTNPVFMRPDGTTKIRAIWDQTIQSTDGYPYDTFFGTEYRREQINEALASENPLDIVPSIDENGHGTMLAGVIAGNTVASEGFSGVVPDAELVIVKLKPAKSVMKNFYAIPDDVLCYQENQIMWGLHYCLLLSRELGQPMVICVGLGTSQGAHEGRFPLGFYMTVLSSYPNLIIVTAAGNEGSLGRHYRGIIDPNIGNDTIELNVGEADKGFSMEIWGDSPGIYYIDILSPSGEYIPRITTSLILNRVISFIFEDTLIYVHYHTSESETGDQLILLRFRNAAEGIWRFNVYGQGDLARGFHVWLPMNGMISEQTYFLQPDIYTTILGPGNVESIITSTAYNPSGGNLFVDASRGFTRNNRPKPDFAAPGVNYLAPNLEQGFTAYSGTGVSAAHTAGIVAMLLEWGSIRGNYPNMNTIEAKKFLIRGARRSGNLIYPNRNWGYGILDIFNTFEILREEQ